MTVAAALCPCCTAVGEALTSSPEHTRCPRCGHVWRSAPQATVSPDYYAEQVARNDEQVPWFRRKVEERQAAVAALIGPGVARVLEIGCAEGGLGAAIKARFALVYEGVEPSQDREQAATRLDRVFGYPAPQLVAEPYDLIVSFQVLEHIADLTAELRAWARLLRVTGSVLLEVPNRAGHPWLSTDLNSEHLHQFTPASLTILLASVGLSCEVLSCGHYESPLYCDSIRVIARPVLSPEQQRRRLLQRFAECLDGPFIAYGAGGDFHNYVAPLAAELPIRALVDSAAEKHGQTIGGHCVSAYDPQQHAGLPILICSLRYGSAIRRQLLEQGIAAERLMALESLFEVH